MVLQASDKPWRSEEVLWGYKRNKKERDLGFGEGKDFTECQERILSTSNMQVFVEWQYTWISLISTEDTENWRDISRLCTKIPIVHGGEEQIKQVIPINYGEDHNGEVYRLWENIAYLILREKVKKVKSCDLKHNYEPAKQEKQYKIRGKWRILKKLEDQSTRY